MSLADFPTLPDPLLPDVRHLSCPLPGWWVEKAKEEIHYRKTYERLSKQRSKWKYDITDCQCISAFGDDSHDERNECEVCGKCIADEPALADRNSTSEDKGYCLICVIELENCTIEDIAGIFNRTY